MQRRWSFREYDPEIVERRLRDEIVEATSALKAELAPTLQQVAIANDTVTLQNLVGSVRLPSGDIIEVSPKVPAAEDWTTAVIHLLTPATRIAVTGSQRSEPSSRKDDLTTALALEYARRLDQGIRDDGPLQVYERRHSLSRRVSGHLEVSKWVRSAVVDPTLFPISRDELSTENDFTRGMSIVAGMLSRSAAGGELSSRLRRLQTRIVPGSAVPTYVNPAVARRTLPPQWRLYRSAWDIAAPLLRNRSVIGDPGRANGLEVAIEPWPLLETLLERALRSLAKREGALWEFVPKAKYELLSHRGNIASEVEPDGLLLDLEGRPAAAFEAKYTVPGWKPNREHVYQALSTAAALSSPTSVIVYPGDQPETRFEVAGFDGKPVQLITLGLSLFSYRRGTGDEARADLIHNALAPQGEAEGRLNLPNGSS